jgi:hypothetical protein
MIMAENQEQKVTEYNPSRAEKRLVETLLDPSNRTKTITEICKLAKCSRQKYYKAFINPGFVEYYKQESKRLANKYLGPVMNAFAKEAARGSYQHGKVLLEMAGAYKETVRKEVTGPEGGPVETTHTERIDLSGLTDEELEILGRIISKSQSGQDTNKG